MNVNQSQFVTEYLRFGNPLIAYRNAYNSMLSGIEIESASDELLRDPEIQEAIDSAQARIRHQVEEELREEMKKELLTVRRKRELLMQIAEGEMCFEQYYKGKNCHQCTILVRPTISQILRAIDLDSRLAGHYPEVRKTQQNTTSHSKLSSPVERPAPHLCGEHPKGEVVHPTATTEKEKPQKTQHFATTSAKKNENHNPSPTDSGRHSDAPLRLFCLFPVWIKRL